ncbi:MAG: right-handed parallel beta-helix repeat-containing protein, partial [Clostridia bacterium]|nr:right-handed parallel beta-helix repeat-containing protein [Clostridia bacterium]
SAITTSLSTMELLHSQFLRRMSSYHTLDGLKIYGFLTTGWYKEMLTVGSYDFDTHEMYISDYMNARSAYWTGGLRYELQDDGTYFIWDAIDMCFCNMSEDLDAQGEYWVDTAAEKIYVYGEPENCHILGGEGQMISLDGGFVSFIGLDFYNSADVVISAYGDGITVERCSFAGCDAEYAVHLEIPEDANASGPAAGTTVRDCEFSNCAGNGLFIEGCRRNLNQFLGEANVTVDNCYFTECNLVVSNTAALRVNTSGATVTHNYFYSTSWGGIDYGRTSFMTAKYNVFDRVCYNGDDIGVVYSWDFPVMFGNVFSNNLFHAGSGGMTGRFCAYLDNSTGTEFKSNILYDCGHGVVSNGNRDNYVHDNVIINTDDSETPIEVRDGGTVITQEAGRTGDFSAVLSDHNYIEWKAFIDRIAANPDLRALIAERLPHLLTYTADVTRWNEPEFVLNIVVDVTGNRYLNPTAHTYEYSDALKLFGNYEGNMGYTLEENPLFVNPTIGDYRIREGVDFPDIEFEKIGRY